MFKAKDIMNTDIVTLSPNDTVDKAIELMLQYRITECADLGGNQQVSDEQVCAPVTMAAVASDELA